MKRRRVLGTTLLGAAALWQGSRLESDPSPASKAPPLVPPAKGKIPVAVLISEGATVIDFAGPWEVFQDTHVESRGSSMDEQMPFELFTVSESLQPLRGSGGLQLVPDHTFDSAPAPRVVVLGAQRGHTPAAIEWLRKVARNADLVMSVCTGAFLLAKTGLLAGHEATTHHDFYEQFEKAFPDVKLRRGLRYVESSRIATAGGLSAGIDLALHVVERYFGRAVAEQTAGYMEYQGSGWKS